MFPGSRSTPTSFRAPCTSLAWLSSTSRLIAPTFSSAFNVATERSLISVMTFPFAPAGRRPLLVVVLCLAARQEGDRASGDTSGREGDVRVDDLLGCTREHRTADPRRHRLDRGPRRPGPPPAPPPPRAPPAPCPRPRPPPPRRRRGG